MMKRIIYSLIFMLLVITSAYSQTKEKPWTIGGFYGKSEYYGDLGNGLFKFDKAFYGFGTISIARFLSPRFNVALEGGYGGHGYFIAKNDPMNFGSHRIFGEAHIQFHFVKNGNAIFRPYIFAGVGVRKLTDPGSTQYVPPTCNEGTDLVIPGGLGLDFKLYKNLRIRYVAKLGYTNHDVRDRDNSEAGNDFQFDQSIGLTLNVGPKIDTDGDGVADRKDKCPDTPAGALVDATGCIIDRDKDGFADNQDDCPDNAGIAKFKGCPDRDNDGIMDKDDECPDTPGLAEFKGCPDSDKDGVEDRKDECPNLAGLPQFNGCPDTDGDGIIDPKDKCPGEAGPVETEGCPDRDKDGILDKDDKCPDVYGILANKGCPEIKQEVKQIFEKALQGIQFETGKDVIKGASFQILNDVVLVMQENPEYNLSIYGHTDNVGAEDMNMTLSQKRADSVKKYLTDKGVPANRIVEAKGFGESMPVDSNDTAAGRAKNRRVEFKVTF